MPAERLYYYDQDQLEFQAEVTDIHLASQKGTNATWQVALDRTAFYPTSGGQPYDTGELEAVARSGAKLVVPVLQTEEDENGEVWHTTSKPLLAGTMITGRVDRARRRDHTLQHTGQHLLSAIFVRALNAPTVSFHLGEEVSTIDLDIGAIVPETIVEVERLCNEEIDAARAIHAREVSREEADAMLATGLLRKIPPREGNIRVIEIVDLDLNACGGTHLSSTAQLGSLLIRKTEKVRQGIRVEFVCGMRAIKAARRDFDTLAQTARTLSIGSDLVPGQVEKLLSEVKSSAKERSSLLEEIATLQASSLAQNAGPIVEAKLADHDLAYAKMLASKITASNPAIYAIIAATQADPATVIFARGADAKVNCGELLKAVLSSHGLRGGGNPAMAQGAVPVALVDTLMAQLREGCQL